MSLGVGMEATAKYGLTHQLQLGAAVHVNFFPSARFDNAGGSLLEDALGFGLSAFGAFRIDTGYRWAPFVSARLGAELLLGSRRQWRPAGGNYGMALDSTSAFGAVARAALGIEYRIGDYWLATLSAAYRRTLARGAPAWQVEVPIAVGRIW